MQGKKYFFPFHLGSGNRGCEGILRGTMSIMQLPASATYALNNSISDYLFDKKIGLDKIVILLNPQPNKSSQRAFYFILRVLRKIRLCKTVLLEHYLLNWSWPKLDENSIVFITGGDLYTYESMIERLILITAKVMNSRSRTVLFGCSIDEKLLSKRVVKNLCSYSAICVRESLSEEVLKNVGITSPIYLFPDPAFVLLPDECELPLEFFNRQMVGINISNYTNMGFEIKTRFMKNIVNTIEYILNKTDMGVCLMPHVFWPDQDDRVLLRQVKKYFANNEKVFLLNGEDLTYQQLRFVISKCRFFIGARTHSVISAYSMQIPAIALGYSIKSKGIAKDIGISPDFVIDCHNLDSDNTILSAFEKMMINEKDIRNHYKQFIPVYINKAKQAREILNYL